MYLYNIIPVANRDQKKVSEPLDLVLQMTVSCPGVGVAGN